MYFQTIIAGIEQVADAIGCFFIELGQLIEEIIEALSVLFQFGHIIDTHNILKAELLKRINGDPDNSDAYPGFATLVDGQRRAAGGQVLRDTANKPSATALDTGWPTR